MYFTIHISLFELIGLGIMIMGLNAITLALWTMAAMDGRTEVKTKVTPTKPDFSLSREQLVSLSAEDVHAIARGEKTQPDAVRQGVA